MIVKQSFGVAYFDGYTKASFDCTLRDRWKNVRTVLVSQSDFKNTGPRAGTTHMQLR